MFSNHIFKKKVIIHHNYAIDNSVFNRLTKIRDLGVILSFDLTFTEHISFTVNKALRSLGLRNASEFKSLISLKVLYFSYVLSILEFASVVWFPYYFIHIIRLERVQNRFLRFAARLLGISFDFFSHNYDDLRSNLGLPKVESRFRYNDLLFFI